MSLSAVIEFDRRQAADIERRFGRTRHAARRGLSVFVRAVIFAGARAAFGVDVLH